VSSVRSSVSLGRVAGVRVNANISVLVIVAILVPGLAFGRFPAVLPGRSTTAYVVASLVATVALLASLLAHELAHAVVARRNGIEVESITLWLFGGVARLTGEPRTPGADLRIAGIGPLTSLALGLVFGSSALGASLLGTDDLPVAVLAYLAGINVLLAMFNLVPAAPLDGGRVLRALLWVVWRDRTRAAVTAARAGRYFGYGLIVLGLLQVVTGASLAGLWLALIGLFVVNAAAAEEQQTRLGSSLHGVLVAHAMSPAPVVADPGRTVDEFVRNTVLTHRFSTYPLAEPEGRLAGLVTLNRIRDVAPEQRATTRLADIACPPQDVTIARPDEPLLDLLPRMNGTPDRRAVVVDDTGGIVAIVSPSDISRAVQIFALRAPEPAPSSRGADVTTAPVDPRHPEDPA